MSNSASKHRACGASHWQLHAAEDVLPGHPDRIADAIAESLVDTAVALDPGALVGVEVGVHRRSVFVTGRIAAEHVRADLTDTVFSLAPLVARVVGEAGYRDAWDLAPDGWHENEAFDLAFERFLVARRRQAGLVSADEAREEFARTHGRIVSDLDVGKFAPYEGGIRHFSDDQNLLVGHACGSAATGFLPPAPYVARRLRGALQALRERHSQRLGPDGKVLVRLHEERGRFSWQRCNVALQHVADVSYEELHTLVVPALEETLPGLDAALPGLGASWSREQLRVNGAGDFSCGGPLGDNGLSGKKLVVDHYGPGVPIGGGALCGKDPHKVDRAGALRARQLAVRLVRDAGAPDATVVLGFVPGAPAPDFLAARVDGAWWDEARIAKEIPLPDLGIQATVRDLELTRVRWADVARRGYFGEGWAWE